MFKYIALALILALEIGLPISPALAVSGTNIAPLSTGWPAQWTDGDLRTIQVCPCISINTPSPVATWKSAYTITDIVFYVGGNDGETMTGYLKYDGGTLKFTDVGYGTTLNVPSIKTKTLQVFLTSGGGPDQNISVQELEVFGAPTSQYLGVTGIPDADGDRQADQALLYLNAGRYYLRTLSSATGKTLRLVFLGPNLTPIDLTTVDKRVSILIRKSDGTSGLQWRDSRTGALVKTINLPN